MQTRFVWGYGAALGSAALVGLFTVLNKWLLVEQVPALTAGAWTYLAAGLALPWAFRAGKLRVRRPLTFAGWLLAGSVFGPSLHFLGLNLTSGVQGVLMINMEVVFTALLAFVIFREHLTWRTVGASLTVLREGYGSPGPGVGASLLAGSTHKGRPFLLCFRGKRMGHAYPRSTTVVTRPSSHPTKSFLTRAILPPAHCRENAPYR